jgi:alpha-mannosidase
MSHAFHRTALKIARRLQLVAPFVLRQRAPLPSFRYQQQPAASDAPPIAPDHDDSAWPVIEPHRYWGAWRTHFTLRTRFTVPAGWDAAHVALYLPLGDAGDFSHPEAMAYLDGEAYAAADRHHQLIQLGARYADGRAHALALFGWTGLGGDVLNRERTQLYMRECAVVTVDPDLHAFVTAARVALDVVGQVQASDPAHDRLLNALDAAFLALDTRDPLPGEALYATAPHALAVLRDGLAQAGPPLDVEIVAAGHAHIDVAWLWPLGQTRRKAARTFATQLRLLEQYPDYHFSQSQPQLYQYVEQDEPALFAQIQQRAREGRWELMGGAWVEPDCNAIGAESLVRQLVLGRRYYRERFPDAPDTPVLWLPDTFGYAWALPQLIQGAGMRYFVTHKMSWNQYNRMPNQWFWWQGLDGTRVLTYFLTTPGGVSADLPHSTTYNAVMDAREVFGTWRNFQQKHAALPHLVAYGYGDGGGGPTPAMIENAQHFAAHPAAPRVRMGSIRQFFEQAEAGETAALPVWNGEFYLEYHRGTYTSQSRNKRANRQCETLLHNAEYLAAYASVAAGAPYPHAELRRAWELLCLNQFHDILPGSSITEVYEDSARDYQAIRAIGDAVIEASLHALTAAPHLQQQPQSALLLLNPAPYGADRAGVQLVHVPAFAEADAHGAQPVADGVLLDVSGLAPYELRIARRGVESASPVREPARIRAASDGSHTLENGELRVVVDASGELAHVYHKRADREVLATGETGNRLIACEDRPLDYDAWDIDSYYEERAEPVHGVTGIRIVEQGPLRVALAVTRRYRSSTIEQIIRLAHAGARLDFVTHIDWHEQHTLLKVAFPVRVLAPHATFDVQWGNVQRPTHRNTTWDMARFETCAHKWVDLSEADYGVALLNDCKYGHDVHGHTLRVTLLKSATMPDPHADQGAHDLTYSLLPHTGDWREMVPAHACALNNPPIVRLLQTLPGTAHLGSLVTTDEGRLVIETIKLADDGSGLIVRLYENERRRGTERIRTRFPLAAAAVCNLLEEHEADLPIEAGGHSAALAYTPYQIITLRLVFASDDRAGARP